MSIAHYTVNIPESATICPDWPALYEETRLNYGNFTLDKKHGGYVIEDKGVIALVCTDELCAIIEEKDKEAATITFHHPASGVAIGNYTVTLPEIARVCSTWPSLAIVIACDGEMSAVCEEHPEQLEFIAEDVAELLRSRGV